MKLIDRDALWERLTGKSKYYDAPPEDWSEIWDVIEGMPLVNPDSHWISCKERLPELWDYVLCSQINGDVGEGKLLDDECWHICYDQSHREKTWVVAWQPLPEKFKGEGGEDE